MTYRKKICKSDIPQNFFFFSIINEDPHKLGKNEYETNFDIRAIQFFSEWSEVLEILL